MALNREDWTKEEQEIYDWGYEEGHAEGVEEGYDQGYYDGQNSKD